MPRQKKLEDYPQEYYQTVAVAYEQGSVRICCDNHQEAKGLRGHMYNFRTALRQSKQPSETLEKIEHLTFQIDGTTLLVMRKHAQEREKLQEALKNAN